MSRPERYYLDGHEPKPAPYDETDYRYFVDICKTIKENTFGHEGIGMMHVSTIFLGIDHARRGPPILFETMIFVDRDGVHGFDNYQTRCSTWDQAMQMHADACAYVKNAFAELAKVSGA